MEGVNMTLTGTFLQNPSPQCKTINLDNPTNPDYTGTSTFLSTPSEQEYGWNNCWNVSHLIKNDSKTEQPVLGPTRWPCICSCGDLDRVWPMVP